MTHVPIRRTPPGSLSDKRVYRLPHGWRGGERHSERSLRRQPGFRSPEDHHGFEPAGLVATATTSAAHGYSNNDVVTIDVGTNSEGWSGTFQIYDASGSTFAYRMNRTPIPSPGGTMEARKVSGYRFDTVMAALGANTCVHLGPTPANRPFLTKGYPGSGGWQAKAGMRILGSGIDLTVLRLVGDAVAGTYYAIGHSFAGGPVDCFEVAELTVDCNLMIPTAVTSAGCGAVRVLGSHVRVGRIKVINWGGNAAAKLSAVCLVMADDAASGVIATDSGMENVIAVSPASSELGALITALHVGPAVDDGLSAKERYGLAPYIRNCFVDCGWPTITTEFRGVAMAWCKGGVVEGNQIHNTKHGGPYASLSSARDIVVRNNYYKQVAKGPFWNYTSPTPALLASIVRESRTPDIEQRDR